jgi:hypothetical protein
LNNAKPKDKRGVLNLHRQLKKHPLCTLVVGLVVGLEVLDKQPTTTVQE